MRKHYGLTWSSAALALILCSAAWADHDHDHGDGGHHHDDYHWHGDIHHFHERDYPHWREGYWYHGNHGGRLGWWWAVGGLWYLYPTPVYPYPDPYTPPVIYQQQYPTSEEQTSAPADAPPPAQNWYYCNSSKNYYPYVSSCREGWKIVPATPPGAPE